MSEHNSSGYWKILEPIWYDKDLSSYIADVYLKRFKELTKAQQVLFPTHWFYSEIYNGGFYQCFRNSTGLFAPEAVLGFRDLGLNLTSELVQKAMDIFDKPYPREQEKRCFFLDSFIGETEGEWNPFYKLDEEFFASLKVDGAKVWEDDKFLIVADEYAQRNLK